MEFLDDESRFEAQWSQDTKIWNSQDWRIADPEWLVINSEPRSTDPGVNYCPRLLVAEASEQERHIEMDRTCAKVARKRVPFQRGTPILDRSSVDLLKDIVEVLLDYPELLVRIECSRCSDEVEAISRQRAMVCKDKLAELGAINPVEWKDMGDDTSGTLTRGLARLLPRVEQRLVHDPQERVNLILSKATFDFEPESQELTARGNLAAELCARALKETRNPILITMPRFSADLEIARCEVIRKTLIVKGITNEILLRRSERHQAGVSLQILSAGGHELGPQVHLREILEAMPIVFVPGREEVVGDCLPVLSRCASVLAGVPFSVTKCTVEVYPSFAEMEAGSVMDALPLRRAKHIAAQLRARGVTLDIACRGRIYPFSAASEPASVTVAAANSRPPHGAVSMTPGPCVVKPGPRVVMTIDDARQGLEDTKTVEIEKLKMRQDPWALCLSLVTCSCGRA